MDNIWISGQRRGSGESLLFISVFENLQLIIILFRWTDSKPFKPVGSFVSGVPVSLQRNVWSLTYINILITQRKNNRIITTAVGKLCFVWIEMMTTAWAWMGITRGYSKAETLGLIGLIRITEYYRTPVVQGSEHTYLKTLTETHWTTCLQTALWRLNSISGIDTK